MVEKNIACKYCDKVFTFEVDEAGFEKWDSGKEFIQEALPDLSAGQRELLISGTCDDCWKQFFGDE